MTALAIRHQRSEGSILLSMGAEGPKRLRESHAAKLRIPVRSREAILINTGGGLAGGDRFFYDISAEDDARLTVTGQAAERVYRTLGPAAEVEVRLTAGDRATLMWLPQETILFDGAALTRGINADLGGGARFLAVESVLLGRVAMGEAVAAAHFRDRWRVRQKGKLIHADDIAFDGAPPSSAATLGPARAFATVVLIAEDAEDRLDRVRAVLAPTDAASAWNGKLVARLVAGDGFDLRKSLIPALTVLAGPASLPKTWSF